MAQSPEGNAGQQVAPSGWYPDPRREGGVRWWNGAEWTDYTAVPPGKPRATAGRASRIGGLPPRRSVKLVIGLAVVDAVVLAVGLAAIVNDTALTDRLLTADFRKGSKPFVTGASADYDIDVVDGTYRIRSRTAEAGPATSFARFRRTAYAVDMSADVASVSKDSFFGVGCLHDTRRSEGYVLLAHTEGGVALGRTDSGTGSNTKGKPIAINEQAAVPAGNVRLQLSCRNRPVGPSVSLKGYVNGHEVIAGTDDRGFDGFQAGSLVFENPRLGAEVRFSRADAAVTGTSTSGEPGP